MKKLICFDMDGVIFEYSNFWMELHKRYGTYDEGVELTEKYLKTNYEKLVEEVVGRLWKGKPESVFIELVDSDTYVQGAEELFKWLKDHEYMIAVISSGPKMLKMDPEATKAFMRELEIKYFGDSDDDIKGFETIILPEFGEKKRTIDIPSSEYAHEPEVGFLDLKGKKNDFYIVRVSTTSKSNPFIGRNIVFSYSSKRGKVYGLPSKIGVTRMRRIDPSFDNPETVIITYTKRFYDVGVKRASVTDPFPYITEAEAAKLKYKKPDGIPDFLEHPRLEVKFHTPGQVEKLT